MCPPHSATSWALVYAPVGWRMFSPTLLYCRLGFLPPITIEQDNFWLSFPKVNIFLNTDIPPTTPARVQVFINFCKDNMYPLKEGYYAPKWQLKANARKTYGARCWVREGKKEHKVSKSSRGWPDTGMRAWCMKNGTSLTKKGLRSNGGDEKRSKKEPGF